MGCVCKISLAAVSGLTLALSVGAKPLCSTSLTSNIPAPVVSDGYKAGLVENGLQSPRGIIFDSEGHLLVVESGKGIRALTLDDQNGPCVSVKKSKMVVTDSSLNHGIELSHHEKHLFASSSNTVFKWQYDPKDAKVTTKKMAIVTNMTNDDHTTRTLLISKKKLGTLIVSRGSQSNIDSLAADRSSGHSQLKAFNLLTRKDKVYDFTKDGRILGWGLRNDVGVGEEPKHGGLYSVENSADEVSRDGFNFHENNPAEEMNYFGTLLDNKSPNQGGNFGYPTCFAAWNVDEIPSNDGITVGSQWSLDPDTVSDDDCRKKYVAPRMVFEAHSAPLDIKFDKLGAHAWVTFHGSWDRTTPSGYSVAKIPFKDGHPVAPSTTLTGAHFIVKNQNPNDCPNNCFRPVGLTHDKRGRVYFSSDATGEIYIVSKS